MPIYTGANVNNKLRSISGLAPMINKTRETEINYAKANNLTNDIIWYTEVYSDRMLIELLILLIGKSTDTQTIFGAGNNKSYVSESNTGIKKSGIMDNKGLFWGNQDNVSGVKLFGMEHLWGNTWRAVAGWINDNGTQKIKMTYGQNDGSAVNGYNLDGTGYISVANSTPSGTWGGYIDKMKISNIGLFPVTTNGSSSTYYCDGFWFNNSQVNCALIGGSTVNKLSTGIFGYNLNAAVSDANWNFCASLSCKPLAPTP